MITQMQEMAQQLRQHLKGFEPDRVSPSDAASVLEVAAEVERLAGSIKLLATSRAASSRRWATEGHRSAASWVAQKSKVSYGEAMSTLETARRLTQLPRTVKALKRGGLSGPQAKEVAQGASADPSAERDLLLIAAEGSMKKLKDRARKAVFVSTSRLDELARYRALHGARYLRHWCDVDGAFRLDAKLTPDTGARLVASIQSEADSIAASVREEGNSESPQACRADALVALVTGTAPSRRTGGRNGSGRSHSDTLVIRVDARALRRGFTKGSETCEVPGVGPVPVATAERLLDSAFVKILVRDGVDISTVCHVGRTVPTHVQSALEERDPRCVVPGCDVSTGLECHHWTESYAKSGTTSMDCLARVCHRHHAQITYDRYELSGGPGRWRYSPPPRSAADR